MTLMDEIEKALSDFPENLQQELRRELNNIRGMKTEKNFQKKVDDLVSSHIILMTFAIKQQGTLNQMQNQNEQNVKTLQEFFRAGSDRLSKEISVMSKKQDSQAEKNDKDHNELRAEMRNIKSEQEEKFENRHKETQDKLDILMKRTIS